METDFWLERWRLNQIGFHQQEINAHLQEFWPGLTIAPPGQVFVPLCGKSRDMLWLRARGHGVRGVEISPIAVRDFFSENGLTPQISGQGRLERWETDGLAILRGDFFDLVPDDLRDVVGIYDRASMVALPPPMRERYASHLMSLAPRAAVILLVTMEYPEGEMQGPPYCVHETEVQKLYGDAYDIERLFVLDMLAENPRFRDRGLTHLQEKVFRLLPLGRG